MRGRPLRLLTTDCLPCTGRLEQIMAAKKKLLEFDSDFDDIDGSMHSSELSELDSDVHSLSSLRSCAQSWIEDVEYKAPAEGWVKFATPAAMVRSWMPPRFAPAAVGAASHVLAAMQCSHMPV